MGFNKRRRPRGPPSTVDKYCPRLASSGEIAGLAEEDVHCLRTVSVRGIGQIVSNAMMAAIGRREVAEAFVVAAVIVVADEVVDLGFAVARQIVVLQQDAILERLVPAFDLALGQPEKWATHGPRSKIAEKWTGPNHLKSLVPAEGLEPPTP